MEPEKVGPANSQFPWRNEFCEGGRDRFIAFAFSGCFGLWNLPLFSWRDGEGGGLDFFPLTYNLSRSLGSKEGKDKREKGLSVMVIQLSSHVWQQRTGTCEKGESLPVASPSFFASRGTLFGQSFFSPDLSTLYVRRYLWCNLAAGILRPPRPISWLYYTDALERRRCAAGVSLAESKKGRGSPL